MKLLTQGTATSPQAVCMLAHQPVVSIGNSGPPAVANMHLHSHMCTCCVGMLDASKGSRSASSTMPCHASPLVTAHLTSRGVLTGHNESTKGVAAKQLVCRTAFIHISAPSRCGLLTSLLLGDSTPPAFARPELRPACRLSLAVTTGNLLDVCSRMPLLPAQTVQKHPGLPDPASSVKDSNTEFKVRKHARKLTMECRTPHCCSVRSAAKWETEDYISLY